MCGRYTLRRISVVYSAFGATPYQATFEEFDEKRLVPRFNIAPSQSVPVVRLTSEGERVVEFMRWGLIPYWTKAKPKNCPCNARAETVASSGMFKSAFERRRCLVPADGFYEWQGSKPPKQPYFIRRSDDRLFAFAGLWERWHPDKDAEPVDTVTIITTAPNAAVAPIHNRMPVILDEADYTKWLDSTVPGEAVADLLCPSNADLKTTPISTAVNSVKNDGPELIES
jgi:putative SOS response-associated peptidase YedK